MTQDFKVFWWWVFIIIAFVFAGILAVVLWLPTLGHSFEWHNKLGEVLRDPDWLNKEKKDV